LKILIAEDDAPTRRVLESVLAGRNYEVISVPDGNAAWARLEAPDAPKLAILDWMMPGMDGEEICRRVRGVFCLNPVYIILLTGRENPQDVILGLTAGANDYIRKPFDREELLARIQVGERLIDLQSLLVKRMEDLQAALSKIKTLQGLLPICSYCRKVRNDKNYWLELEVYISRNTDAEFSHGICPKCMEKHIKPQLEQLQGRK
jgi:sigma-B regulation protein RsbU (phosphoserine phosphatase)